MKRSIWKAALLLNFVAAGDVLADPPVPGNDKPSEAPAASESVELRVRFKPGTRTLYMHEVNTVIGMGAPAAKDGNVRFHMLDAVEEFELEITQTFLSEEPLPPEPDAVKPKASTSGDAPASPKEAGSPENSENFDNPETGGAAATAPGDAAALSPPAGSPERTAIMDVLRFDFYKDKDAARKNEKKILFVVKHLKMKDGWACVNGLPTRDGKEVGEPRWAVLRKTKDGWVDVDYFAKLRPFASEAEAMDALDMSKGMVKRLLPKLPGCPEEIFP